MRITTKVIARARLAEPVWPKVLVAVSDLHQNSRGRHDNFQAVLFQDFLRDQLKRYGSAFTLMILGNRRDNLEEPSGARIARNNLLTDRMIARIETEEVPGNHENVAGADRFLYYIARETLFAWHGDLLDLACSGRGRLDRIGSAVWSVLERVGLGGILGRVKDALQRAVQRRRKTAARREDDNQVYIEDAEKRIEQAVRAGLRGILLYLCGHTHVPELLELAGGRVFGNCGSWTTPGRGYAIIVDGCDVSLAEVTGDETI